MSLASSAAMTCLLQIFHCKIAYLLITGGLAAYQTQACSISEEETSGHSISQPLQWHPY